MDEHLITTFREEISETSYTVNTFFNVNGKNQWNCICSSMDWITLAVKDIDFIHKTNGKIHGSEKTFDILTLLMRVALIKEGIEQLHRVLYNTEKQYRKDDKSVWHGEPFGETDNEYFETLRACFGAHPVNLKGMNENNIRRFASWPFLGMDGCFSVFLYPSDSKKDPLLLKIYFNELEKFASLRYQHLEDMIQIIKQGNLKVEKEKYETSI